MNFEYMVTRDSRATRSNALKFWRKERWIENELNGTFTAFWTSWFAPCPVWLSFLWFSLIDPAVDDFVLMHCVFMPNSQLCPLLMAQYPFCLLHTDFTFLYSYCLWYPPSGQYTSHLLTNPLGWTRLLFVAHRKNATDRILDCATHWFGLQKCWSSSWPSSTNELLSHTTTPFTPH